MWYYFWGRLQKTLEPILESNQEQTLAWAECKLNFIGFYNFYLLFS